MMPYVDITVKKFPHQPLEVREVLVQIHGSIKNIMINTGMRYKVYVHGVDLMRDVPKGMKWGWTIRVGGIDVKEGYGANKMEATQGAYDYLRSIESNMQLAYVV